MENYIDYIDRILILIYIIIKNIYSIANCSGASDERIGIFAIYIQNLQWDPLWMKFETYLRTVSIVRHITKDLTQAWVTVHSDHPKSRMLVAFTGWELGEPKGEKPRKSPPGASVPRVSEGRGVTREKSTWNFLDFLRRALRDALVTTRYRSTHKFSHDRIRGD